MKKAALYLRVSTEEQRQNGLSIDTQKEALIEYCNKNGYTYEIYNDAGLSARKSYKRRPELLRMLSDCQKGKIQLVLFTRLDRFFRSVSDYYECLAQMNEVPWRAIFEDYETETPEGKFKVNIMLSVAQAEADKTSARIKDSYAYRKARGEYIGLPPVGYKVVNKKLEKDSQTRKGVEALFKTYLSTFSTAKAMRAAANYGVYFERANLPKVLKSPTYAGTTSNGHICEPYITKEEHEKIIQVKRARKVKAIYSDRVYLFSGLIVCGYCGHRLHGKIRGKEKNGKKYWWTRYTCSAELGTIRHHPHLEISEPKVEKYLLDNLTQIIANLSYKATLDDKGAIDREKEQRRLKGKLERLKEVYIEGDISREEYHQRKVSIESDLASIPTEQRQLPTLPDNWKETYQSLTKENQQAFWKSIIKQIILTNETKEKMDVIFL